MKKLNVPMVPLQRDLLVDWNARGDRIALALLVEVDAKGKAPAQVSFLITKGGGMSREKVVQRFTGKQWTEANVAYKMEKT